MQQRFKKFAIVGAGFAGLAAAWHLLRQGAEVTLFDDQEIGAGTSGASTGLLHPFPAKWAERSWRADEAMQAAKELLAVSQEALGRPVFSPSGILRLALSEEQVNAFPKNDPDAEWRDVSSKEFPYPGLWIPSGVTVYSRLYLEGLWRALEKRGGKWVKQKVEKLDGFDVKIFANGSAVLQMPGCAHLPLRARKGQALLCRWPEPPLSCSVIGDGHISLTEDPRLCLLGSTYGDAPAESLREQIGAFFAPARELEIVEVRSGIRMAPKNGYRPIIEKIDRNTWVFSGLGSRGLLYHALMARELIESILSSL